MDEIILSVGSAFYAEISRSSEKSPGECVMVVRRPNDRVLLMTKGFYPSGIYRLPTGKLKYNEPPNEAIGRELLEETGFHPEIITHIGTIYTHFAHESERIIQYPSYVFTTEETSAEPKAIDIEENITGFRELDVCELHQVVAQLRALPEPWYDWGKWRAVAHDFVWCKLCQPHY